ncbi:MAG TPA: hypothetical protein VGH19_11395 [Verrucomicrobiae bacterium]
MRIAAAILLLLGQSIIQAALVWEPVTQTQVVFVDRPAAVYQDIRNDEDRAVTESLRLKLLQSTSSTAAPIPGWEQKKQLVVPAKQTIKTTVELTLPKVTSPTRFRITWSSEVGALLGDTEIIGCPADLFAPLRKLSSREPVGIAGDSDNRLATLLRSQGCQVREVRNWEDMKSNMALLVNVSGKGKDDDLSRLAAQYAKEWGGKVVWLVESDSRSLTPEPAVCVFPHGQGTLVVGTGIGLSDLSQNPLSQLRLVWLVELARSSEENRLMLLGRLMNL